MLNRLNPSTAVALSVESASVAVLGAVAPTPALALALALRDKSRIVSDGDPCRKEVSPPLTGAGLMVDC